MSSPCPKESGFTLLEIMMAVLILGLVVSMITVSLSGSINAIDVTMKQGELYYRAQVAMERICEDLTSALLTSDKEFIGGKGSESNDQSILLSFSSMAHIVLDPENDAPGMGRINYALQADQDHDGHLLLLRSDVLQRPTEDGKGVGEVEAFILADRLRSVTFTFFDHLGEEQGSWDTTVQEDDEEAKAKRRVPAAVTCRLEFWINEEEEQTLSLQTSVLLPTGLIQAKPEEN
ncbi:MAG: prepilin-type N-terminal cleavage/methylation domain-containing protein [Candidatus Electrothrix sp. GM3_4]|nr:prepilin-type N-terminal cleavage/methylation domain-containing protein [Candidatus Electrothrix sp. GM3_4]